MRVAAIQYGNHDCSACIYDGKVQNYFLEERYSGKKHDSNHFEIYKQLLKVKEPIDLIVCATLVIEHSCTKMVLSIFIFF